jgi:hypothetical protein
MPFLDLSLIPPLTEAEAEALSRAPTMRERGWNALFGIAEPDVRQDAKEYVLHLEAQLRKARDDASRLRFGDN